jgi:hypothetical protein
MSAYDLEPTTPPPGHGENVPPLPGRRCPHCSRLVQNERPAAHKPGELAPWLGWCPEHGTVRLP